MSSITSALKASAYRRLSQAATFPNWRTWPASTRANAKVTIAAVKLMISIAARRRTAKATAAAITGLARIAMSSIDVRLASQLPQLADVHRVEGFANAIDQDSKGHRSDKK